MGAREPVKRSWERFAAAFDEESHATRRAATPAQLDAFFNRDPDVPAVETDDIPAEVACLEKLGAKVADRLERWVVMQAPTGQRFCVVRVQRPGFPKNANRWD
jgi:Glyoxalase-like domain